MKVKLYNTEQKNQILIDFQLLVSVNVLEYRDSDFPIYSQGAVQWAVHRNEETIAWNSERSDF